MSDATAYGRKYRAEHREELREYGRKYRAEHAEALRTSKLQRQRANAPAINAKQREARRADPDRFHATTRRYRTNLKIEVIGLLGGKCECCQEAVTEFLCIDHRSGGGSTHRKALTSQGKCGYTIYRQIRDDPAVRPLYRVLCLNCNFSVHLGKGVCIHQRPVAV